MWKYSNHKAKIVIFFSPNKTFSKNERNEIKFQERYHGELLTI